MGTTPNYSWPYPESSDYVADGASAIENLADAIDTSVKSIDDAMGLVLLDDKTFTGYGGISSDVLNANNYLSYLVVFDGFLDTGASGLYMRYRRSGSDITTNNYEYSFVTVTFSSGTIGSANSSASTNMRLGGVTPTGGHLSMTITLSTGNRAMANWQNVYGGQNSASGGGNFYDGSAVTGFTIYRTANLAGFKLRVYGLTN